MPPVDLEVTSLASQLQQPHPFVVTQGAPVSGNATIDCGQTNPQCYLITYTATVKNAGQSTLTGVSFTATIQPNSQFPTVGNWTSSDQINWVLQLGTLTPGQASTVIFVVSTPPLFFGDTYNLAVSATDDHSHGQDLNQGNNSATLATTIAVPATTTPNPSPTVTPTFPGSIVPTATATSVPVGTSVTIGPNSATVLTNSNGSVTILAPVGSVSSQMILVYAPTPTPTLNGGLVALQAFDLSIQQTTQLTSLTTTPYQFTAPIVVTVGYDSTQAHQIDPNTLSLAYLDATGVWQELPSVVDRQNNLVSASVGFTGRFALIASTTPKPFVIYLPIIPQMIQSGW